MKRLFLAFIFFAGVANAACDDLYPNNQKINVPATVELCNKFYVSIFSPSKHAVVATIERLRKGQPISKVPRVDSFRSDPRVGAVPAPSQYVNSGYDKGHMAPAGDSSTPEEMSESFFMTNMTPQSPQLNRGDWRRLEMSVRDMYAKAQNDVFVITIAEYNSAAVMGSIPIPTGYWKIVLVDGQTFYYHADNVATGKVVRSNPVDIRALLWR